MSDAPPPTAAPVTITGRAPDGRSSEALVAEIQEVMLNAMIGDEAAVAAHFAENAEFWFVGRRLNGASEIAAFNAARYQWVRKAIAEWDVAYGETRIVVTSTGTLYGAWPDGTPFEGNRYIDRFVLVDGRITRMDVWNDSAERLLTRAAAAP